MYLWRHGHPKHALEAGATRQEKTFVSHSPNEFLESSDALRSAKPLKYAQTVTFEGPLKLELGGSLERVTVVYETYGTLNADKSNAILICHPISGDSHVVRHDDHDDAGWWDMAGTKEAVVVGPGKIIDTNRFFVICPNILGGCRGTTGPNSINPATGRPYGRDFPVITVDDMVQVHRMLVDHLGIERLLAALGGSMGGHQVLAWAKRFPQRIRGAIALATSPRLTSQALAFDVVGRNAILRDPNYNGGQYYDGGPGPAVGLALARMIGHITYLSPQAMKEKFEADRHRPRDVDTDFEKKFSVGSYLGYQGDKFVERFDANSYLALTMAMDLFDLGAAKRDLVAALAPSPCRWLVVSFTSDWLFPAEQSRRIVDALLAADKEVSYCNVASDCGHDAFLLPDDLASYGEMIRAFLARLDGNGHHVPAAPVSSDADPTSIFHTGRVDYDNILALIPPGASVLDMGCGNGGLLAQIKRRDHGRIVGVELDENEIIECVRQGLDVIQADLNKGLTFFADDHFDYVVLSQTLQTVRDVELLVADMLRVGRRCVVSFPNFAYRQLRQMLWTEGRAPEATGGLLRHKWYDSPNIRFLSIADFESFCQEKDIVVHRRIALDTETRREVTDDPNLNADLAIFVLSK